jgi:hypothetical protein
MGELEQLREDNKRLRLLLATATELLSKSKELLAQKSRPSGAKKKKIPPKRRARSM